MDRASLQEQLTSRFVVILYLVFVFKNTLTDWQLILGRDATDARRLHETSFAKHLSLHNTLSFRFLFKMERIRRIPSMLCQDVLGCQLITL